MTETDNEIGDLAAGVGATATLAAAARAAATKRGLIHDPFAEPAVILVSGLDARSYRLWWRTGTTVFEIDQPQVVEFKSQTMRRLGITPTANRRAVGIDLRGDWPTALQRVGFDITKATAWIAEGLLIGLLSPGAQDRLLDHVDALSAPGSRFAADYSPGLSSECGDVADYLAKRGWDTARTTLADLVAAIGPAGLQPTDFAGTAASTRYVTAVRT